MFKLRRIPVMLVVVVLLAATGVVTSLRHPTNASVLPSGLAVSIDAESTALYCTGLSSSSGAQGRVTFYNTSATSRSLSVSVVSDRGTTWHGTVELAAHAAQSIQPSVVDKGVAGDNYGVAVQISGGGVVGEEIAGTDRAEVPCVASAETHWYATGLSTVTGSSAYLSVYNPTATSAVFNASIYGTTGVSEPQAFQGVSVPAHTQTEINLGKEVVNTSNVGVGVNVLRGSLEIVGVEDSAGVASFDQGVTEATSMSTFPNVTTVQGASAQLDVVNPTAQPANVTVDVALSTYKIAPQTTTVAPFSTGVIAITPNPAIPAAGYASLSVHSNVAILSTLATGTSSWFALSAPEPPQDAFLVRDFTGLHFDVATIVNTSSHSVTFTIETLSSSTTTPLSESKGVKLAAGATMNLAASSTIPAFNTSGDAYLIAAPKHSLVVSMTLPSRPKGVNVVAPLDGR